ncbi:L-amino acid N-acyltransferase YncA [Mycobacteroides chelonae]|nr:L-amino acid N-acyltransferase YncA [Mycobacteroides chelonae]
MPNLAREKLHLAMGFEQVALYRRIGYKLGSWHDVAHFQLFLTYPDDDSAPGLPPGVA